MCCAMSSVYVGSGKCKFIHTKSTLTKGNEENKVFPTNGTKRNKSIMLSGYFELNVIII